MEGGVLTSGPPGKSQQLILIFNILQTFFFFPTVRYTSYACVTFFKNGNIFLKKSMLLYQLTTHK